MEGDKVMCPACGQIVDARETVCTNFDCLRPLAGTPAGVPEARSAGAGTLPPVTGEGRADGAPGPSAFAAGGAIVFRVTGAEGIIRARDGDVLGRGAPGCGCLDGRLTVSRRHARVFREGRDWFVEDLGSHNGVFKDGRRVARARLEAGDSVSLSASCELFVSMC